MNDGYMPLVPHYNGDQIRQPPILRTRLRIRLGAKKRTIFASSTMSNDRRSQCVYPIRQKNTARLPLGILQLPYQC